MVPPDPIAPSDAKEWATLRLLRVLVEIAAASTPAPQPEDIHHGLGSTRPEAALETIVFSESEMGKSLGVQTASVAYGGKESE